MAALLRLSVSRVGLWILSDLRVITSPHSPLENLDWGKGSGHCVCKAHSSATGVSFILSAQTLLHHNTVGLLPRFEGSAAHLSLRGCGDPQRGSLPSSQALSSPRTDPTPRSGHVFLPSLTPL